MSQITVKIYIDRAAALKSNSPEWGETEITLTSEMLVELSDEDKQEIAEAGERLYDMGYGSPNITADVGGLAGVEATCAKRRDFRVACIKRQALEREQAIKAWLESPIAASWYAGDPLSTKKCSFKTLFLDGKVTLLESIPEIAAVMPELEKRLAEAQVKADEENVKNLTEYRTREAARKAREEKEAAEKAAKEKSKRAAIERWARYHAPNASHAWERFQANCLPEAEALKGINDFVFGRLGLTSGLYAKLVFPMSAHEEDYCDGGIEFEYEDNPDLTAAEWEALQHVKELVEAGIKPGLVDLTDVSVIVREHTATCERCEAALASRGIMVHAFWHGVPVWREFAIPVED